MTHWFGILKPMGVLLVVVMLLPMAYGADNYSPANNNLIVDTSVEPPARMSPADIYDGKLRVYIAEPDSRWYNTNYHRPQYHYGFLDFALTEDFSLGETDTLEWDITWDASDNGWSGVRSDNISVIAVVSRANWVWGYSDPPTGNPFQAYYTDASAAAMPYEFGQNTIVPGFTHSIFIEEGTGTWCPYCVYQIDALHSIMQSGDYPMTMVALVEDKSSIAHNRCIIDYNLSGYPTSWFDGGQLVIVGGWSGMEGQIRARIEAVGSRVVTGLFLKVETDWIDPDIVTAHITLYQGDATNMAPADPGTPAGPTVLLKGLSYEFSTSCTDPENDDVYYMWAVGSDTTGWLGPFGSGDPVIDSSAFDALGSYDLSVKARDKWDQETNWSPALTVEVYLCGDCDQSTMVDIDDAVWLIQYIFSGGDAPYPLEAGDVDCSGAIDIDDVVFLIQYIFSGGVAPCSACS